MNEHMAGDKADEVALSARRAVGVGHHHGVPKVKGLVPFVGILLKLWRDPARGLNQLYRDYGPIFEVPLLGRKAWISMGPEVLNTVFKTHADVCSARVGYEPFTWIIGEPVGMLDGEAHRRIRRILQLANQLGRVGPVMAQTVEEATTQWDSVSLWEVTRRLSFNVILRAGLGVTREEAPELELLFDNIAHALFAPKIPLPFTRHARGARARTKIDAWLNAHVDRTRKAPERRGDILAALVSMMDEGKVDLRNDELLDNLCLLVFAGQETTASVLAWAIVELARAPQLWQEVVREVPTDAPLPVTLGEAQQYKFLGALLNESLRRYSPSWFVGRGVQTHDLQVLGHDVPFGTFLAASVLATHHMDELWPDPFRFDVTRWLSNKKPPAGAFWPFGGGPHVCLGAAFSTLEMLQVLVALARRRRRPVLEGDYDLRPVLLDLPHPSADIRIAFKAS